MGTYGRNFDFRVPPQPEQRASRYVTPTTGTAIPIGVPVEVTGTAADVNGRNPVAVATGPTPKRQGLSGILVYEHAPTDTAFAGLDRARATFSDLDTAPLGAPVQVCSGTSVKVVLRNDDGTAFKGSIGNPGGSSHKARTMVAGIGALQVGDFLVPKAAPDDATGYWEETATEADAWLVVTAVNATRGEVEARMTF